MKYGEYLLRRGQGQSREQTPKRSEAKPWDSRAPSVRKSRSTLKCESMLGEIDRLLLGSVTIKTERIMKTARCDSSLHRTASTLRSRDYSNLIVLHSNTHSGDLRSSDAAHTLLFVSKIFRRIDKPQRRRKQEAHLRSEGACSIEAFILPIARV